MTHVDLMRPWPGWQRCCICFEARRVEEWYVDAAGQTWDLCPGLCALQAGVMTERERLFTIITAMMSNGCCPCPPDICDCFGGIPYEATRDIDLYVKEIP